MDMVNSSVVPFSIALVFIAAVITKVAWAKITADPAPSCNNTQPHPPMVITGITSAVRLLHTLLTKGFIAMLQEQYTKLGSVFTISFLGMKTTFLAGPDVSAHFYQGLESEISHGNILEFTVPMFGKDVAFGVDIATRTEQHRFYLDALKPAKLRCHVAPMLQEVEVSNITCMHAYFHSFSSVSPLSLSLSLSFSHTHMMRCEKINTVNKI
jgi:sterol 14-demethylase